MLRSLGWLALVVVAALALAGLLAWQAYQQRLQAPLPLSQTRTVLIPCGAGLAAIGRALAAAGIIDSPGFLRLHLMLSGRDLAARFGEYRVEPGTTLPQLLDQLAQGRTVQHRLTVPEGWTTWQILARVDALIAEGLLVADAAASPTRCGGARGDDPAAAPPGRSRAELAAQVTGTTALVPQATPPFPVPAEGSLAPDTYAFTRGDWAGDVLARMARRQQQILTQAWETRAAGLPLASPEEALVLASIVERETGVAAERARVAGVFINRLRAGMRLQSDPTALYDVSQRTGQLERPLTRADLALDTPHNTYVIAGLPPGPIAHPGQAAIAATLNPESHDYLYFVADGTGGHAFAETYEQHLANVERWRAVQRARRDAAGQGAGAGAQ